MIADVHAPSARTLTPERSTRAGRRGRTFLLGGVAVVVGLAFGRFALAAGDEHVGSPPAAVRDPAVVLANLEAAVAADAADVASWRALGVAYVREAARSADPRLYELADHALATAERLAPGAAATATAHGLLALARHEFEDAFEAGAAAHAADPFDADALGVLVDASAELGRYTDAEAYLDEMLRVRPDLQALARVSYLRELHGDVPGARSAMLAAETAGAGAPFDVATVIALQGDIAFHHGDLLAAADAYDRALRVQPDLLAAELGLARVEAARGDLEPAIERLEAVVERAPVTAALVLLSDLLLAAGDADGAARQNEVVRAVFALAAGNGVVTDLEAAMFEIDHGGDVATAMRSASAAYDSRPTIFAADTLGWALTRAGDPNAALAYVEAALALGTEDANLHWHAAVAHAGAGDDALAGEHLRRALAINPYFTIAYRTEVEALAESLGVEVPG